MIVISYLILNSIAVIFGIKEAMLFERQGVESFKWNFHKLFVIERALLILLLISGIFINLHDTLFISIAYLFSFSFFHNGAYGYTKLSIRNLKPTLKEGLVYVSDKDAAKNTYDFNSRLYMLLTSLIIIIVRLVINYY